MEMKDWKGLLALMLAVLMTLGSLALAEETPRVEGEVAEAVEAPAEPSKEEPPVVEEAPV